MKSLITRIRTNLAKLRRAYHLALQVDEHMGAIARCEAEARGEIQRLWDELRAALQEEMHRAEAVARAGGRKPGQRERQGLHDLAAHLTRALIAAQKVFMRAGARTGKTARVTHTEEG